MARAPTNEWVSMTSRHACRRRVRSRPIHRKWVSDCISHSAIYCTRKLAIYCRSHFCDLLQAFTRLVWNVLQLSRLLQRITLCLPYFCVSNLLNKTLLQKNYGLYQGSSTIWVRGPIYIFHIILRAAVIADYKIIMDTLNIIIGAWAARQGT